MRFVFDRYTFKTGRLLISIALALFCGVGFSVVSHFNCGRFGTTFVPPIHASLFDAQIPFVPSWVWVYLMYYPFCFLPILLSEIRNDRSMFQKTVNAFALQFGVSFMFFIFVPLRMIHPSIPSGATSLIFKTLYGFDLGFSSFPSLHLANITFISCLFLQLRGNRLGLLVSGIAVLIAASTLLVKQHFISDVFLGALLGWGSYVIFFCFPMVTNLSPAPTPGSHSGIVD